MSGEVPVWVGGAKKWVTGLGRKTTCDDVVKALVESDRRLRAGAGSDVTGYVIVERWRKVERPLEGKVKLLKAWNAWGEEQPNVRLSLKGTHARHSKGKAAESTHKSYRRKPQAKVKWRQMVGAKTTTIHPKKLLTLQQDGRKWSSESMEGLMRVIIAQGETIHQQLRRLEAKEEQIEIYEQRVHRKRLQTMGANYLLDSYLQQEAEAGPTSTADDMQECIHYYDRLLRVSERLEREESTLQWLMVELDSERQGQRATGGGPQEEEHVLEEVRAKVERMSAINKRNLIELEANEMQLTQVSVCLENKGCLIRHLECDLRQSEEEGRQLHNMIENIISVHPTHVTRCPPRPQSSAAKDTTCCPLADTDSNSDTGLSSLHSSSDDVILDTLV